MRSLLFAVFLFAAGLANAQIYSASTGEVTFFSEAPLENIEAKNTLGKSLINTANKEIAVIIPIKGFRFDKALMEEHFNENYMESEKFPNAIFKGKLQENIDFTKDGVYDVTAVGTMNVHGVEVPRTLAGTLTIKDGKMQLVTKFPVALKDHDVKIPTAVFKNIAEVVEVKAIMHYELKK